MFSEVGSRMEESDGLGEVFGRLGRRLCDGKGQDIRTIWGEEMGRYLLRTRLSAGEKEMILSFPSAVWYLDGQRQQAAVEAFAQRFMEEAKRARQAQSRWRLALPAGHSQRSCWRERTGESGWRSV